MSGCSVADCDRKHEARGFCSRHYQQFKRTPEFGARPCSVDGCVSPSWARTWCQAHYQRWQNNGDPVAMNPRRRADCKVEGCEAKAESFQLCPTHLARQRRTGTTDAYVPVIERFDLFVPEGGAGQCWEWLGPTNNKGYGKIGFLYAHRVACERAHGPAPSADSVAMHSCDNPPCVNPEHLRWGFQSENIRDMWSRGRRSRKANA